MSSQKTAQILTYESSDGTDFVGQLYTDCVDASTILAESLESFSLQIGDKRRFLESAGRLYLWGETFPGRKINTLLNHSTSLYLTVIRFLVIIAKVQIKRKSADIPPPNSILTTLYRTLLAT